MPFHVIPLPITAGGTHLPSPSLLLTVQSAPSQILSSEFFEPPQTRSFEMKRKWRTAKCICVSQPGGHLISKEKGTSFGATSAPPQLGFAGLMALTGELVFRGKTDLSGRLAKIPSGSLLVTECKCSSQPSKAQALPEDAHSLFFRDRSCSNAGRPGARPKPSSDPTWFPQGNGEFNPPFLRRVSRGPLDCQAQN